MLRLRFTLPTFSGFGFFNLQVHFEEDPTNLDSISVIRTPEIRLESAPVRKLKEKLWFSFCISLTYSYLCPQKKAVNRLAAAWKCPLEGHFRGEESPGNTGHLAS